MPSWVRYLVVDSRLHGDFMASTRGTAHSFVAYWGGRVVKLESEEVSYVSRW